MRLFCKICVLIVVCTSMPICAQTHISVPVDNRVYYIIEQAELRGLCQPLPGVKPYSQQVIIKAINEILETDAQFSLAALSEKERAILQETLDFFAPVQGIDVHRGEFYYDTYLGKKNIKMSFNAGIGWDTLIGISSDMGRGSNEFGTDNWFKLFLRGDMGDNFSWDFSASGGVIRAPVKFLGTYFPYYDGFTSGYLDNTPIEMFSEPIPFFPYEYRKKWDGSVFYSDDLSSTGFYSWPQSIAFGYNIMGEISASFLEGHILLRGGRFLREWGAESSGASMVLNSGARPFLAVEGVFTPFRWLSFSAITGVLEYFTSRGIVESGRTFQNAFSMALLEAGYKNYVRFKFGSNVIWPKRFELGYPFPLNSNFFYQNNIGDFDNMGIYASLSGGFPGIGKAWFSLLLDELDLGSSPFFNLDRNMYAFQLGISAAVPIPLLPFTNVVLQYTKIEPYTYSHLRVKTPWYGEALMEEAYLNNGVSLGYYLPPNSDELKFRMETMFTKDTNFHLQYQMIRHGADYGSRSVDGSSISSELDPIDRDEKPVLRKFFLHDGAYQWQHILKIGMEHTLSKMLIPVQLFFEAGFVWSFFTDIDGEPNSGKSYPYHAIDTSEYPKQNRIMATIGFRIWPK